MGYEIKIGGANYSEKENKITISYDVINVDRKGTPDERELTDALEIDVGDAAPDDLHALIEARVRTQVERKARAGTILAKLVNGAGTVGEVTLVDTISFPAKEPKPGTEAAKP